LQARVSEWTDCNQSEAAQMTIATEKSELNKKQQQDKEWKVPIYTE